MISGPVGIVVIRYKGREYHLISDIHNSIEGGCDMKCDDMGDNLSRNSKCVTLPLHIHNQLCNANRDKKYIDVYIESPFVLEDYNNPPTPIGITKMDMIEQLQIRFEKSMRRDKSYSNYLPYGRVHYCDIRDVYTGDQFRENGIRESSSANPLSASWCKRRLSRAGESGEDFNTVIPEIDDHLTLILNNARCVFESFITPHFDISYYYNTSNSIADYNDRIKRMGFMTSMFGGIRIHRVCKQLLKLDTTQRRCIENWVKARFERELAASYGRLDLWRERVSWFLASGEPSIYDEVKEMPIMISVVLGSIIMDTYTLARSMYHNESDTVIFYTGSAHTQNYVEFFLLNGGEIVREIQPVEGTQRCLVVR